LPPSELLHSSGVFFLAGWFAASGASAASLQVSPILLEVAAPGATTTVTLRNNGMKPIATQVRVFRWIQEEGRERLEPTEDVVASPPAVDLPPAQDYVIRAVRVTKRSIEGEEAYRLIIDELPESPQRQRTVNFVVRHVIPLLFDAPDASAPDVKWQIAQSKRTISLTAVNRGDRRFRLASVRMRDGAGKGVSFGPGLVGYALGRSTMSWTVSASRSVFTPGAEVSITGQTEEGPFDAQAVVQSAP
jgi:fimbrial chaperone protein